MSGFWGARNRPGPETGQKHTSPDFPGLRGGCGRNARAPNLNAGPTSPIWGQDNRVLGGPRTTFGPGRIEVGGSKIKSDFFPFVAVPIMALFFSKTERFFFSVSGA